MHQRPLDLKGFVILLSLFYAMVAPAAPTKIHLWDQDPPEVGAEIDKWSAVFMKRNPDIEIVRQNFDNEVCEPSF